MTTERSRSRASGNRYPLSLQYGIAVLAPVVAALLRIALNPLFGIRQPLVTFYMAVMVSGWYGGIAPGIVSTVISGLIADYLWFAPVYSLGVANAGDVIALLIFAVTGSIISVLNESLHRAKRRETLAQQRLSMLVEAAPTAMVAVDGRGIVVFVNAMSERLFGYRRDELVGSSVDQLVPERFRSDHSQRRREFLRDPLARPMGAGRDLYAVKKDGTEVPIEIGLSPIDLDGDALVLSSIADITERKRAENERAQLFERERQARAEADAANQSKDVFLARVSHELRTPLNALMGWVRMLRDGQLAAERAQHAIAAVDRSADALNRLVEDLVDMSRITTGNLQLNRHHLDLAALVRESIAMHEFAASAKHVRIDVDIEPRAMVVDGDATRLRQIVWNLVSNAIKFTPENGRVTLTMRSTDDEAKIHVADTGQGIAPEFLQHVFEPFSQADHGGKGLGLGLSIVQQLVIAHGGHVSVASPGTGAGTTFTVVLPLVRVDVAV